MTDPDTESGSFLDQTDTSLNAVSPEKQAIAAQAVEVQRKIDKVLVKINENQKKRENHLAQFINFETGGSQDPGLYQRMKSYFEKHNERLNKETEMLQKKMKKYQEKLQLLKLDVFPTPSHKIQHPGSFIKGVANSVKEVSVLKTRLKNKRYPSADHITTNTSTTSSTNDDSKTCKTSRTLPSSFQPQPVQAQKASSTGNTLPNHDEDEEVEGNSSVTNESGGLLQTPVILNQEILDDLGKKYDSLNHRFDNYDQYQKEILQQLTSLNDRFIRIESDHLNTDSEIKMIQENVADISNSFNQFKDAVNENISQTDFKVVETGKETTEKITHLDAKITSLEHRADQQLPDFGVGNSASARAVITKVVNVALAIVTVILVMLSMIATLSGPLLSTKIRTVMSVIMVGLIAVAVQYWDIIKDELLQLYRQYLANRSL
ncbi:DgyrCDS10846 [Dimorphilus gyrociliatus]|uniref:DgyrCDS10846 n=1 Tax=Dimorphilus gyrociliatus TaxID=2664684 RepID=A0A7I8W6K0_9ANNE|nr:DgyrCDS10846 [Dimorphilus gyrociliatus]